MRLTANVMDEQNSRFFNSRIIVHLLNAILKLTGKDKASDELCTNFFVKESGLFLIKNC
jgi:hypothetical protein